MEKPPSLRKQRSRSQILDAATNVFDLHGVEGVSMAQIARRAGLTRATLYNLFSSKDDIAAAVVQRQTDDWDDEFRLRMARGENALKLIRQALVKNTRTCLTHPELALHVVSKPQEIVNFSDGQNRKSFRVLVRDLLAQCQDQGRIRRDKAPADLMHMVLGLYFQMLLFALTLRKDLSDKEIEQMLQLLLEGIGPQKETS